MANEHIAVLKAARAKLVEMRRVQAAKIADSDHMQPTADAIASLVHAQAAINTVDAAIKDERPGQDSTW